MSEARAERSASVGSSSTAAASYDEKDIELSKIEHPEDGLAGRSSNDGPEGETERDTFLPKEPEKPEPPKSTFMSSLIWMVVNTLATIGIVCPASPTRACDTLLTSHLQVFTNKAIFSDDSLRLVQLTFAAFHFFVTWLTLYTLSRPSFAFFVPRRAAIRDIIPLSIAMSLNVILPNLSLAFSSVTFYQVARILLTPTVAAMNYVLYKSTLPQAAILALVPACAGVGMVSYYDSLPSGDANVKTTSGLGVFFAFSGIFASSLYTVWIASYHRKLQMSSMQLLFNQAPVSAFLLLYVIPFADTFPVWSEVQLNRWVMILMVCVACASPLLDEHQLIRPPSPACLPHSSTFPSSSSLRKQAPSRPPWLVTSRHVRLWRSAGQHRVVP
jgi:solute carrier family 35, member E3